MGLWNFRSNFHVLEFFLGGEKKETFKSTISSSGRLFICFARGESYSEI